MGEVSRKKRVKFLGIDVEPVEVALIVKYEVRPGSCCGCCFFCWCRCWCWW